MTNFDTLSQMTGMKKPTHRGRRSRGKGSKPLVAPTVEAHAALNDAMEELPETGDHDKAKKAALNLVKFLHAQSTKKADA